MTNHTSYTDYQPPVTRRDEIEWLADWLSAMDKPLTAANALAALEHFRANAPGEWLLEPREIPELWAEYILDKATV